MSAELNWSTIPAIGPDAGPARVLVVLDRPLLLELVMLTLKHSVCILRSATTPEEVAVVAATWQPHLLILDMALDGLRVVHQVRTRTGAGAHPLVIGLVGRGDLRSKLACFDAGVDDILTIPFEPEELLARVTALMRRRSTSAPIVLTPVISVGELEIDIVKRVVRAGDSELQLTPLELGLLYLLAANPGRVLTREEIVDTLYGTDGGAARNVVDQHIRKLRARLQTDRQPRFIATVPGRGYRFLPSGQSD